MFHAFIDELIPKPYHIVFISHVYIYIDHTSDDMFAASSSRLCSFQLTERVYGHRIHVCYLVTYTINIPPMLAYIPYMDPMGWQTIWFGEGDGQCDTPPDAVEWRSMNPQQSPEITKSPPLKSFWITISHHEIPTSPGNERCSYCVVPFTRGSEQSRPMSSIRRETVAGKTSGHPLGSSPFFDKNPLVGSMAISGS